MHTLPNYNTNALLYRIAELTGEIDRVRDERDIYRQAIIDFLTSAEWAEDKDESILINALGKSRLPKKD